LVGAAQESVTEPREVVGGSGVGASDTLLAVNETAAAEDWAPAMVNEVTTNE
jgi:hypothetical protein